MNMLERTLMRMFGRPEGALGRLGGIIMARMNREMARSVIGLLQIHSNEQVLEVGFGPGVGIALLAKSAPSGHVAGVDPSTQGNRAKPMKSFLRTPVALWVIFARGSVLLLKSSLYFC